MKQVEFEYVPGDRVYVIDLDLYARVVEVSCSVFEGRLYRCRYFFEGKLLSEWLYGNELRNTKSRDTL